VRDILKRNYESSKLERLDLVNQLCGNLDDDEKVDDNCEPVLFDVRADEKGNVTSQRVRSGLERWQYGAKLIEEIMHGYPSEGKLEHGAIEEIKERVYARMVSWDGLEAADNDDELKEQNRRKMLLAKLFESDAARVEVSVLHGGFSGRCVVKCRIGTYLEAVQHVGLPRRKCRDQARVVNLKCLTMNHELTAASSQHRAPGELYQA
jgi:hypothetical protein